MWLPMKLLKMNCKAAVMHVYAIASQSSAHHYLLVISLSITITALEQIMCIWVVVIKVLHSHIAEGGTGQASPEIIC